MSTSIFLSREISSGHYVSGGGRGFPKPMQLGLREGIYWVGRCIMLMRTNP